MKVKEISEETLKHRGVTFYVTENKEWNERNLPKDMVELNKYSKLVRFEVHSLKKLKEFLDYEIVFTGITDIGGGMFAVIRELAE